MEQVVRDDGVAGSNPATPRPERTTSRITSKDVAPLFALKAALERMVYETTSLSPLEDDGSHWCRISKDALEDARAALRGARDGH